MRREIYYTNMTQIMEYRAQGLTIREIAKKLNIPKSTVHKVLQKAILKNWVKIEKMSKKEIENKVKGVKEFLTTDEHPHMDELKKWHWERSKEEYETAVKEIVPMVLSLRKRGYKKSAIHKTFEKKIRRYGDLKISEHIIREVLKATLEVTKPKHPPKPLGRKPKEYPVEELKRMRKTGLSIRQIAEKTGISKSTVHRLLSKKLETKK